MRSLIVVTCILLAGAGAALAEPVSGMWKTEPGDSWCLSCMSKSHPAEQKFAAQSPKS